MSYARTLVRRPGIALGLAGLAVGFGLQRGEGAVMAAIVGYFVGKSIQSLLWTFDGGGE